MMAETSPARLQSCFGSLFVNFGFKLHWHLCSGSLSPHSHHPVRASQIGPNIQICFLIPHKTVLCRATWMHSITAPLECGGVLYETLLHCCETNTRIPFHSGERSSKTDSAKTLSAALGTNLNSFPTMLHTGPRAKCSFEGTQLDLHRSVL